MLHPNFDFPFPFPTIQVVAYRIERLLPGPFRTIFRELEYEFNTLEGHHASKHGNMHTTF
jgi:hypothetical protein